jgi:hypothetical protein
MKPLGPDEGINALRHPDCRFCDEHQRLMRGPTEEVRQLKNKVAELEGGDASAPERTRRDRTASTDVAEPQSVGEDGLGPERFPAEIWLAGIGERDHSVAWFPERPEHVHFTAAQRYVAAAPPHPAEQERDDAKGDALYAALQCKELRDERDAAGEKLQELLKWVEDQADDFKAKAEIGNGLDLEDDSAQAAFRSVAARIRKMGEGRGA